MTEKPTQDMTLGEMLAEIGLDLREVGKYYAANWGLIARNPEYPQLAKNTPLYINCKPYSVKRSVKDGERDLVRLAHEVPYEGSWFYTPKDSTWYHVSRGHEEEFGERGLFRFSSIQGCNNLTIPGNEIIHYHTHPKRAGEHMTTYAWTELERKMEGIEVDTVKKFLTASMYLYSAFPSVPDVRLYQEWSQLFKEQGPIIFQGRVASPIGITSVEIFDNSDNAILVYEQVHRELVSRMAEGKHVRYEEHDGKPTITVALEDMFDHVTAEMQGKLRLTFRQADCGFAL